MTQGIFIEGYRPNSKKQIKEAVKEGKRVTLEATSLHGGDYGGLLTEAPNGRYFFVGPDPYTNRRFYGNITIKGGKITVK